MTATARLDLRLDAKDKDRIAHAAELLGVPLATFVRQAALREAASVSAEGTADVALSARLRGRATLRLSTDDIMRLTRDA